MNYFAVILGALIALVIVFAIAAIPNFLDFLADRRYAKFVAQDAAARAAARR